MIERPDFFLRTYFGNDARIEKASLSTLRLVALGLVFENSLGPAVAMRPATEAPQLGESLAAAGGSAGSRANARSSRSV